MSSSSTSDQEQIVTALDAEAGWQAAAMAEQRERALLIRLRVQFNTIETHRPKVQAWTRIMQILIKEETPEEVVRLIREEVRKGNTESDIRETQLKKTDQKSREDPRAAGVGSRA